MVGAFLHQCLISFAPVVPSMKFAQISKQLTINYIIFSEWVLSRPSPIRTRMRPGPNPKPGTYEAGTLPFFPCLSKSPVILLPWGMHGGGGGDVHQRLTSYRAAASRSSIDRVQVHQHSSPLFRSHPSIPSPSWCVFVVYGSSFSPWSTASKNVLWFLCQSTSRGFSVSADLSMWVNDESLLWMSHFLHLVWIFSYHFCKYSWWQNCPCYHTRQTSMHAF